MLPCQGQADANSGSFGYDPGGLRFETKHDARRYAVNVKQRSNQWAARECGTFSERYLGGGSYLYAVCDISPLCVGEFVFSGVPFVHKLKMPDEPLAADARPCVGDNHGGQRTVYFAVSEFVKGPQGFIPSWVRAEIKQEIPNAAGDALSVALESIFSRTEVVPKWKLRRFGVINTLEMFDRLEDGIIENRSEFVDDVVCDASCLDGDWLGNLDPEVFYPCKGAFISGEDVTPLFAVS